MDKMLSYFLLAITAVTGVLAGGPVELEPAFTLQIGIENPIPVGPVIQGYGISYTVCPNGTIVSAPGAAVLVNATIIAASDIIHVDPGEGRLRLNVHGVARTTTGTIFQFSYTGIATPNEEFNKVLSYAPDAKDTDFGAIVSHHTFEIPVAAPELAGLNNNMFVGAGRLLVNPDRSVTVEYVASRVLTGN
ncbi:hypothetical protein HOY82DRAFT_552485 [Tuber indicum]|nr:hypothetical protein HOY82DRAFT_552485 [Tuber indicum]